jgi:hypothetical protein
MNALRQPSSLRSQRLRLIVTSAIAACAGVALSQTSAAAPPLVATPSAYDIEEVINLGGESRAYGINNDGVVVGYSFPAGCCAHAFDSAATPPFSTSSPSYARGITQAGEVIGDVDISGGGGCYHAAKLWPLSSAGDVDGDNSRCSNGVALNAAGEVLAQSYGRNSGDPRSAMVLMSGGWHILELPAQPAGYGPNSRAGGMNDFGEVVGMLEPTGGSTDMWRPGEAFYWDKTGFASNLNVNVTYPPRHLPFEIRTAAAINNHHRIVGFSGIDLGDGPVVHAYALDRTFYDPPAQKLAHKFVDLGTFPNGGISYALGLNTSNDAVVGAAYQDASGAGNYVATFFTHSRVINLNSKISMFDAMHWTLKEATAINDNGVITGWGIHDGVTRAFVLKPHAHIDVTGVTRQDGALLTIQGTGFYDASRVTIEIRDIDIGGPLSMGYSPVVTASPQGRFSLTLVAPCSRILAINAWDAKTSAYSNMQKLIVPCVH